MIAVASRFLSLPNRDDADSPLRFMVIGLRLVTGEIEGDTGGITSIAVPLSQSSEEATGSCQPVLAEGQRVVPTKVCCREEESPLG